VKDTGSGPMRGERALVKVRELMGMVAVCEPVGRETKPILSGSC
jgi:hypothetical protein